MGSEDNIRRLRRPMDSGPEDRNVFEELEEYERELAEWHERRKNRNPAAGKTKTSELNMDNKGYIWRRPSGKRPGGRGYSGPNDT